MNNAPQANKPATPTSTNGGGIVGTVREAVGNVADKVSDAASTVGQRVSHAASDVGQKVSNVASDAYGSARDAGHQVEHWAEDAYGATARNVGNFGDEVGSLIRKHPIPAVLIGFGVGLLLGRAAKAV